MRKAGGDARSALSTLELSWQTAVAEGAPLEARHVADAARKRPLRYDRDGDQHYDIISAFIKSMRGSDPDAAVYYLAAMLEGGEDARFIARRMVILASEDVGNADPRALVVAVAAAQALEHVGLPEAQLNLAQAAIYLANAPKSNASAQAIWDARSEVRERGIQAPPAALRDAHYAGARDARARRGLRLAPRRPGWRRDRSPPRRSRGPDLLCSLRQRRGERRWQSGRVIRHRSSTSRRRSTSRACACRTFAASATSCSSSTRSRSRPSAARRRSTSRPTSQSFDNAETEVIFVSCDTSAARQAWKQELGATYAFASDFWQHGAAARAYGVFNDETGAPRRGTFLIDKDGVVIWSLVKDEKRTEMVPESLEALDEQP